MFFPFPSFFPYKPWNKYNIPTNMGCVAGFETASPLIRGLNMKKIMLVAPTPNRSCRTWSEFSRSSEWETKKIKITYPHFYISKNTPSLSLYNTLPSLHFPQSPSSPTIQEKKIISTNHGSSQLNSHHIHTSHAHLLHLILCFRYVNY